MPISFSVIFFKPVMYFPKRSQTDSKTGTTSLQIQNCRQTENLKINLEIAVHIELISQDKLCNIIDKKRILHLR